MLLNWETNFLQSQRDLHITVWDSNENMKVDKTLKIGDFLSFSIKYAAKLVSSAFCASRIEYCHKNV